MLCELIISFIEYTMENTEEMTTLKEQYYKFTGRFLSIFSAPIQAYFGQYNVEVYTSIILTYEYLF